MRHLLQAAFLRIATFLLLIKLGTTPAWGQSPHADNQESDGQDAGIEPAPTDVSDGAGDAGSSQDTGGASGPDAAAAHVTAPRLVHFQAAQVPDQYQTRRVSHAVVLRLLVTTTGSVEQAQVHEPGVPRAPALDEAARLAALRFRFEPARRANKPAPAWILYEYLLRWTPSVAANVPLNASHPSRGAGDVEVSASTASPNPSHTARTQAAPVEVVVRGRDFGQRLQESALAVNVVDTGDAKQLSGDLGTVLSRQHGVAVRRLGGLGSSTTMSLNGLQGDQIRLFVDGVPAEFAGYPLGIANLPVGFVERAEVYRGVLPIAYGSDALGGAINVVTADGDRETGYSASYQTGSFNTHRLSAGSQYASPEGWFTRAIGFFDTTDNDYVVEAETFDDFGRLSQADVRRFHDGYRAAGAGLELGVQHVPWARELSVRAFYTTSEKEIQHNALMKVPYGEVTYDKHSAGMQLKFRRTQHPFYLDSTSGYTWVQTNFVDVSECRYDWYGRCIAMPLSGELQPVSLDVTTKRHALFSRNIVSFVPGGPHQLRLGLAPTLTLQSGRNDRIGIGEYDPATAQRTQFSLVSGLEYELRAWNEQLQNIAFLKNYLLVSDTEEELPNGNLRDLYRTAHRLGAGDSLRQWLAPWTYGKASYEWATRLPAAEEMFGNGALIIANLHIAPETSHNLNLGWYADTEPDTWGSISSEVNGFARWSSNQIVLLSNGAYFQYENVLSSRSLGMEGGVHWTSPGQMFGLGGNATWQDVRNTSSSGPFARFDGEYIPNRPYIFANGDARVRIPSVANIADSLTLLWSTHYTHGFYRGWATLGDEEFKARIPAQLIHTAALVYKAPGPETTISASLELSNLTNEQAYDYWGAQRPGRAVAFKLVLTAPGEQNDK